MTAAHHLLRSALSGALIVASAAGEASAQPAASLHTEQVAYRNGDDGTRLTATLSLPSSDGPRPGVVVLTVAGADPLVDRLVADGYAVLLPVRRGFVDVEPLLRATYSDLAGDVRAGLDYLASRPDVDADALALVAQADDTPPAMLAAIATDPAVPLVLLAPPAFSGVETFRLEQRWLAERVGARPTELEALDAYVGRIAEIVLDEPAPYRRELRLEGLRTSSRVQLPPSAAFPADDRQMRFFASPLWHDRLAFEPEAILARLRSPVLVLIGTDDPRAPLEAYGAAVDRGLSAAATSDATTCVVPGRTRHTFTGESVEAIAWWLAARVSGAEPSGYGARVCGAPTGMRQRSSRAPSSPSDHGRRRGI